MRAKAVMGRLPALAFLVALAAAGLWPASIAQAQVQPATAQAPDVAVSPASSTAAQRDATLERIRQERNALLTDRKAQEAECYRKFAVEDCLRSVRASTRGAEVLLRAREIDIKDAERKEKAAERLRAIAEKQVAMPPAGVPGSGQVGTVSRKSVGEKLPPSITLRESDAARRALEQRTKEQERSAAERQHAAGAAEREAQARARYSAKQKEAQERRDRLTRSQAQEAVEGKKPAAPLPVAPASR